MVHKLLGLRLWHKILIGFALGVIVGVVFQDNALKVKFIGDAFIEIIKMIVTPLVFSAIVVGITSLEDVQQLKRIGFKTVGLFLLTAIIASITGIIIGLIFNPGHGLHLPLPTDYVPRTIPSWTQTLLDAIPVNPFAAFAEGKVLQIIVFAFIIGTSIVAIGEPGKPMKNIIISLNEIMHKITQVIIQLSPIGVFGLMAATTGQYGLKTLLPLLNLISAIYAAAFIHLFVTYSIFVKTLGKISPIEFFKSIFPMQAVAFTTASSYATLPVNMECGIKKLSVPEKIASFVYPLGATINMDGCGGLYPAIASIFIANVYGIDLHMIDYLLIVVTATIASLGTAGVPGTATIMLTVTLSTIGLPLEGIGLILGIDRILDMIRTTVNCTGDATVATIITEQERRANQTDSTQENLKPVTE